MMTSQVLRTLAARGLISRDPDPRDSRALQIEIADTGVKLARRAVRVVEAADTAFFDIVKDQDALMRVLRDLGA
jgi:DNA-binding MarR family transcriptional regulator